MLHCCPSLRLLLPLSTEDTLTAAPFGFFSNSTRCMLGVDLYRPAPEKFHQERLESGSLRMDTMKKQRFTKEQIIGVLREQEAGAKTADLARKYAVSQSVATQDPIRGNARSLFRKRRTRSHLFIGRPFWRWPRWSLRQDFASGSMRRAVACRAFPAWGRSRQAPSSRRSETQASSNPVDSLQLGSASCPNNGRSGARNDWGALAGRPGHQLPAPEPRR